MKEIQKLHAFIYRDENGDEGIVSSMIGKYHMPLITGDEALLPALREIALKADLMAPSGDVIEVIFERKAGQG